jgi:hypothetical protein
MYWNGDGEFFFFICHNAVSVLCFSFIDSWVWRVAANARIKRSKGNENNQGSMHQKKENSIQGVIMS